MTEPTSSSPDEFDRIVEGLDLDLSGLDDFDAAAARAATEREARLEEQRHRAAALDEDTDEQSYREPLAYLLRKDGYDVVEAATGDAALERYGPELVRLPLGRSHRHSVELATC